jgi:outer membrane protein assembly factor BamB
LLGEPRAPTQVSFHPASAVSPPRYAPPVGSPPALALAPAGPPARSPGRSASPFILLAVVVALVALVAVGVGVAWRVHAARDRALPPSPKPASPTQPRIRIAPHTIAVGDLDGDSTEDFATLAVDLARGQVRLVGFRGATLQPMWMTPDFDRNVVVGKVLIAGSTLLMVEPNAPIVHAYNGGTGARQGSRDYGQQIIHWSASVSPGVACLYLADQSVRQILAAKLSAPVPASPAVCPPRAPRHDARGADEASDVQLDERHAVVLHFKGRRSSGEFTLVGLDPATWRPRWQRPLPAGVRTGDPPLLAKGGVYLRAGHTTNDESILAFDAETGAPRFVLPAAAQELQAASASRVYVATGDIAEANETVTLFDARTGAPLGAAPHEFPAPPAAP